MTEISVSPKGSRAAEWDRVTFVELYRLTSNVPEAGIHFQGMDIVGVFLDVPVGNLLTVI